jgi:histidinol-phosphate aminotransferase
MTYVAGKSAEQLQRERGLERIVKLGSNENPLGPSPKAIAALLESAATMHRYPDVELGDLRVALAERLDLDVQQLVVGNGSCDIFMILARCMLHPGDEVVISHPAFLMYEVSARAAGAECTFVEPRDYAYDLDAIADAVGERTRIVYVTNPNNPTGLAVGGADLTRFLDRLPASVLVVLDEAYREYVDSPDAPKGRDFVSEGRNLMVTRSFSKIYGLAGMRVGYGIGRPELISLIASHQPPFHTGRLALVAARAALADQEYVEQCRQLNAEGRRYLAEQLSRLGLHVLPSQSNHVLIVGLDDTPAVDDGLQARGVIVRPTDKSFGLPGCIRVTIGTRDENETFVRALTEVLSVIG